MSQHAASTSSIPRPRLDIITGRFLATLREHGVVRAYLFGSVSRGEERPDSGLDLLVAFDGEQDSFAQRLFLAKALERLCGRKVDLVTDIHPAFAPYITPTLVPLPL